MAVRLNRSRSNFSLDINLREAFGREVTEDVALSFGQAVIDTILDRLQENRGSDGRRLKNYSESYAESLEFQANLKSINDPNLELTGEMLSDMDIIEVSPARLKIGFRDATQRDKAYNHHTGDTVPARPFFDLNKSEMERLVREFKPEVERAVTDTFESPIEAIRRFSLLDILEGLDDED